MIPAIEEALLHTRHLHRDLARNLQMHQQKSDAPFNLSSHSIKELQWWIELVTSNNGLPIQQIGNEHPGITIHVETYDIT